MSDKKFMAGWGSWKDELIVAGLLLAFAFIINRGIQIKGLYMDDLYLWSCFGDQTPLQFIFPMGTTRFRFLYYLAAWLELGIVRNHVGWFVPINILLAGCIAYTVYRFGRRLSGRLGIGFLCGILYLLSRMSYYQIGQVYGLMESLALWGALGILYCLYRYVNQEGEGGSTWFGGKHLVLANALYFCVCFVHERYLLLLPLIYLAILFKRGRKKAAWLLPAAVFVVVMVIRTVTTGAVAPAGTGGTSVTDTFQMGTAIRYALDQVLYILGINAGPKHLSGLSWGESPAWIHVLVFFADLAMFLLVILACIRLAKTKDRARRRRHLKNMALFLGFIVLCIGCSSVTIRVEVRWIYVSMTASWLLAAYLFGIVAVRGPALTIPFSSGKDPSGKAMACPAAGRSKGRTGAIVCGGLFALYLVFMLPVEGFYRGEYPNLYFWANQQRYNSLADETYGKYGTDIFGKQVYILGNSYDMSDFTARTFFKEFDPMRKAEGTQVRFIDSIYDIGLITNNVLVLREDPSHEGYQDVTDFVRDLKCQGVYGYYEDGWMDESAQVRVMTGASGRIGLNIYYPGLITGNQRSTITMNGNPLETLTIDRDNSKVELVAEPYQIVTLHFENNFFYEAAKEQRGKKPFSMIVNFTAD